MDLIVTLINSNITGRLMLLKIMKDLEILIVGISIMLIGISNNLEVIAMIYKKRMNCTIHLEALTEFHITLSVLKICPTGRGTATRKPGKWMSKLTGMTYTLNLILKILTRNHLDGEMIKYSDGYKRVIFEVTSLRSPLFIDKTTVSHPLVTITTQILQMIGEKSSVEVVTVIMTQYLIL